MSWKEFEDAIEFLRLLVSDVEAWKYYLRSSFMHMLPPEVRLRIPGQREAARTVTTDAVLDVLGAVDWTARRCWGGAMKDLQGALRAVKPPLLDEEWIPISELIAFITGRLRTSTVSGEVVSASFGHLVGVDDGAGRH